MEEQIVPDYNRCAARHLRNTKRIDRPIRIVQHQRYEHQRPDENVNCVQHDFNLDKAKHLSNVDRCFGGHFGDAREGDGETAEAISDQMGIGNRRQNVQPEVGEG